MKLEDLKLYTLSEHYGVPYMAEASTGKYCLCKDLLALEASHKQREAELIEHIRRLLNCMALANWEGDPTAVAAHDAIKDFL